MKTILVILLGLMLTACANQGGSPAAGSPADPAVVDSKACDSPISRAWDNDIERITYEFGKNCTGKIPACDQAFTYKLTFGKDRYRGTMDLVIAVAKSPSYRCVEPGSASCSFFYDQKGTGKLNITCPGYSTVTFTPGNNLDY